MKQVKFILKLREYDQNVRLFRSLRLTEVFSHIVDRVLIGKIYEELSPETIEDVEALLSIIMFERNFQSIMDPKRKKSFAQFLVKTIPGIGYDRYTPYSYMPAE